jgi:phosphonoacetaldehyde hydrolase
MVSVSQRIQPGPLKAVVLDWAGTAVDFGSFAPTAVFLRLFEGRGVKISPEDARSGMGLMKKDHLRTILARPAVIEAWQTAHGAIPTEADIDDLFEHFIPLQLNVLKDYAEPIPGLLGTIKDLRQRGLKIGSTTGYIRSMMDVLAPVAARNGYQPDCIVCPDDVPAGRPFPWMCYRNAMQLGVFPMSAMVKVGDTLTDIEEGLNAGMWTVGISMTGNLVGMSNSEVESLTLEQQSEIRKRAEAQLYQAGADYVVDGIWDLPAILDKIEACRTQGVRY